MILKYRQWINVSSMLFVSFLFSQYASSATDSEPSASATQATTTVSPITSAEMEQGLAQMMQRQNQRIEDWGKTLTDKDFERSFLLGRQLNKTKRQEVCGIFQRTVDEMFNSAVTNRERLSEQDQKLLTDRNLFIQSLGYEDNIVDTRMGFNCRLR